MMHNTVLIHNDLYYVGGNDRRISLFESAYPVPRGVSYNSYLLLDEKTVLFDTVDLSVSDLFFENLEFLLNGRQLDYVVLNHMEPDHSASFARLTEKYPELTVIANQKTAQMLANYYGFDTTRVHTVKEGDTFSSGRHTLRFV
ncbi:MAG: MBL fold metallo-hydrolase, partial [Clostridia bacterium]|nr:MBL fold metallo-hydrolase [Clostridia bacterium]